MRTSDLSRIRFAWTRIIPWRSICMRERILFVIVAYAYRPYVSACDCGYETIWHYIVIGICSGGRPVCPHAVHVSYNDAQLWRCHIWSIVFFSQSAQRFRLKLKLGKYIIWLIFVPRSDAGFLSVLFAFICHWSRAPPSTSSTHFSSKCPKL